MSQENVELVRRLYVATPGLRDSVPAEDPGFLDRIFRDFFDEDFMVRMPPEYPEGSRVLQGREGMMAFLAMLREAWSEWRFVPERFFDDDDRVLVFVHVIAVGHESGVPVESEVGHIWTIQDGRAKFVGVYRDRSEALKAVGLGE